MYKEIWHWMNFEEQQGFIGKDCPASMCIPRSYLNTPTLIDRATSGFLDLVVPFFSSGPTPSGPETCRLEQMGKVDKRLFGKRLCHHRQYYLQQVHRCEHIMEVLKESYPLLCCSAWSLSFLWPSSSSGVENTLLLSIKRFWGKLFRP